MRSKHSYRSFVQTVTRKKKKKEEEKKERNVNVRNPMEAKGSPSSFSRGIFKIGAHGIDVPILSAVN